MYFSVCFIFLLCSLFFVLLLSALCSLPFAMCYVLGTSALCSVLGAPYQLLCAIYLLFVLCVFSMSRSTIGATSSKLLALQCNLSSKRMQNAEVVWRTLRVDHSSSW